MKTELVRFERAKHPYKLTLMIDPTIADMLKKYARDHRLTMSCIVENLVYNNLGGEKDGTETL